MNDKFYQYLNNNPNISIEDKRYVHHCAQSVDYLNQLNEYINKCTTLIPIASKGNPSANTMLLFYDANSFKSIYEPLRESIMEAELPQWNIYATCFHKTEIINEIDNSVLINECLTINPVEIFVIMTHEQKMQMNIDGLERILESKGLIADIHFIPSGLNVLENCSQFIESLKNNL